MGSRGTLYKHFGGSGTYSGTASQNTWLIQQMKKNKFKKGGLIGSLSSAAKTVGEDGIILANKGEYVLTEDKFKILKETIPLQTKMLEGLQKLNLSPTSIKPQQPTISVRYDNLINVEGNIDKDFADEFKQMGEDISNKLKKDMTGSGKKWLR